MELSIAINQETCIRCGKCVRVCPAAIFTQDISDGEVGVWDIQNCILCGHCAAVCPTSAVEHSEFPAEKVHGIDRSLLPTPRQLMLICKSRRSNRAFSKKPVPMQMLEQILEAAHRAPTASNLQQVEFTLVNDPAKLKTMTDLTVEVFGEVVKKLRNPLVKMILKPRKPDVYKQLPRLEKIIGQYEQGYDPILRGATALIFIHTPAGNSFGCQDSNLAYQNGSLMAESLGVSQFYTGFVCRGIGLDKKSRLAAALGIEGTIHAGMALGIPAFLYPNYTDRKDIKVNRP